jgi:hypothetical protein
LICVIDRIHSQPPYCCCGDETPLVPKVVGIDFGTGEIALVPKVVGMRKTAGYRVIRVQVQNAKKGPPKSIGDPVVIVLCLSLHGGDVETICQCV